MEIRIHKNEQDKIMGLLMAISKEFPEHVADLLQLTRSAKNGITVEVAPLKLHHSRPQENYYRKWVRELANHIGNTPDEMHNYLLGECYGREAVDTGLGLMVRPLQRSSTAEREEYGELIETLIRVAAWHEFVVPPPVKRADHE